MPFRAPVCLLMYYFLPVILQIFYYLNEEKIKNTLTLCQPLCYVY
jgi:hypothetical protein